MRLFHACMSNRQFAGSTIRRMPPNPTRRFDRSGVAQQWFVSLSLCGEEGIFPYLVSAGVAPWDDSGAQRLALQNKSPVSVSSELSQ